MPFPTPTPQEAAQARNTGGFFNTLGHNVLTRSPYLGPLYNIGSTLTHLATGTAGQYGPAPTLVGRIMSWLSGGTGNAPRALPVDQPPTPTTPEGITVSSTPYGPPLPGATPPSPPAAPPVSSALGPGGIPLSVWQQVYGTGRFTNAPAFSGTLAQAMFPGSAIGPFQGPSNPYVNNGLGTPNTVDPSLPGWAATFMTDARARNQI